MSFSDLQMTVTTVLLGALKRQQREDLAIDVRLLKGEDRELTPEFIVTGPKGETLRVTIEVVV